MQLQGLDLAVAEHRGHGFPVNQFHALFEHVVKILGHARHFLGIAFDSDHRHFDRALPQRFARAVDRGVSAADDNHASA